MRKVLVSHRHLICLGYSIEQGKRRSVITVREECCMRLLVAEDHPSLGPDLKKGLERCHYVVDLVANGEDALPLGFEAPNDLIILDILLPTLDALSACRQLPAQNQTLPLLSLPPLA